MKNSLERSAIIAAALVTSFLVGGCSNGGSQEEAMTQFKPETMKAAQTNQDRMREIYKKAGGKWEAMSAEDRAEFIKLCNGSEATAQQGWGYLATEGKNASFAEQQAASRK